VCHFFLWQRSLDEIDVKALPALGAVIAIWVTIFLEFWKRKESAYAVEWGMTHYTEREQPRPEFRGENVRDPVDGRMTKFFPWYEKAKRVLLSQVIIWTLVGMVIATVVGIFVFRKVLNTLGASASALITSALNALQIEIMNAVGSIVSRKLNDYENHRTPTEYENGLVVKNFLFKFVNSYNSLFYIAFFKDQDTSVGGCQYNDYCMTELQIQVAVILGLTIIADNSIEILGPIFAGWKTARENAAFDSSGKELQKTRPELEYDLAPYESTFEDWDELMLQYGYVLLFLVAFPLAPVLALVNNFIEIRLDAGKLSRFCRRPPPSGASSIGRWFDMWQAISYISIITNLAIIVFFTSVIDTPVTQWAEDYYVAAAVPTEAEFIKTWIFLICEHIILAVKFALSNLIDDVPEHIRLHMARQEYFVDILINGQEEEDDDSTHMKKLNEELQNVRGFTFEDVPNKPDPTQMAWSHPDSMSMQQSQQQP